MENLQGYLIRTNLGIIYIDNDGEWRWGGAKKGTNVALFKIRKDAQKFAQTVKMERPSFVKWTRTEPVAYVA